MGSLFVAVYNFFEKKHLLLWSILCIICVVCIWSITRLSFDTNIQKMMPSNDVTNSMNNYVVNADHSNKIIFCISNKTPSHDLDSLLSAKLWLDSLIHAYSNTDLLTGTHEESIDPGDLIQIVHNNLPYFLEEKDYKQLNDAIQEDHIKKYLSKQKELLQTPSGVLINQLVSADPMGIANIALQKFNKLAAQSNLQLKDGVMISEDEQTVLFIISSAHKSSETGRNQQLIDKIDKAIQDCKQQYPNFNIQYFGGPAVGAGNAAQMKFDTILTLSLSIIALLAVTWYVFRKKRITILLFTPVIFGVLLALASCYWIKGSISILALGIGAIILGIALDFSIHFFSHARKAKSIKDNISELAHPLTLGAITTIGAFFILTYANAPVLQDLGWFAAIGLLGASVFTLIFLPHLLSDKWITSTHYKVTLLDKLAKWQPEKNKLLLLLIVIISPILWHYSKNVSFDSNLMHMNYMSSSLKSAENKISQHLDFTLGNVFIINKSADLHQLQINDERIQSIIDTLAMQKAIRYGINPATLLPVEPIAEKRLAIWEAFWTPEKINLAKHNIALAAAAIGFNKELAANFQPNNLILNLYNDSGAYRYIAQMHPFSYKLTDSHLYVGVSQLKIEPGQREQVFNAFKNINNIIVTDNQNLNEQLLHFINIDFNNLIFYSGLLVFIALLIAYGRIELALISFLPMALSWIWILGIMSLAGLQFNFINIIICTLIFGLGDDYSIFMMDSLIHKYKYGHQKLDNARSAVYLSAITTLIGLGVLIFAQHPALKSIAFIAVIGLTSVVFISQVVQPFLFNFFIQNRADIGRMPFTLISFITSVFAFTYFAICCLIVTLLGLILIGLKPLGKKQSKLLFHKIISIGTKSVFYIMMNFRKKVIIEDKHIFDTPKVFIANHTSFLDILIITMIHPKLVLLTANWVWQNPVFGKIVRLAEYYPVVNGAENSIEPLKSLVQRGYSIAVFPEGTRSKTDTINRFKKGAFYIAQTLDIPIVPICIHGAQNTMEKGDYLLKNTPITITIQKAINIDNNQEINYAIASKKIKKELQHSLNIQKELLETPAYFKEQLIKSFIYKGPVLEWYCKVKIKLEKYYEAYHQLLPHNGNFYDLGCGYGFMSFMLHWAKPSRNIIAIDYDEEKIKVAQHNYYFKTEKFKAIQTQLNYTSAPFNQPLQFQHGDLNNIQLTNCNGIIISDALHYLTVENQWLLLDKCMHALLPGGKLIVRDGVQELQERHEKTKITEKFSTEIIKFNKTTNQLSFISQAKIENWCADNGYKLQVLDLSKKLSNLTFVISK